ncbi:hypothetical protein M5K25_010799 [Dendrobium thyrsiflorum]|uniref:Uncharacterized protein n=1 Tax=Dendrobium thyrsiflorum TaxID=117978 RepID=A0ABD0V1K3_DENTH
MLDGEKVSFKAGELPCCSLRSKCRNFRPAGRESRSRSEVERRRRRRRRSTGRKFPSKPASSPVVPSGQNVVTSVRLEGNVEAGAKSTATKEPKKRLVQSLHLFHNELTMLLPLKCRNFRSNWKGKSSNGRGRRQRRREGTSSDEAKSNNDSGAEEARTTYENFRYRYDRRANPYNLGVVENFKEIFFTSIPPSKNNFRARVAQEQGLQPRQSAGGFMSPNMGKGVVDIEVGRKAMAWGEQEAAACIDIEAGLRNEATDEKDCGLNESPLGSDHILPFESLGVRAAVEHRRRPLSWGEEQW